VAAGEDELYADVVIAGGGEAATCPSTIAGFGNARALAKAYQGDPKRASRPYDLERSGFVIGEGAGALVLESEAHAAGRGAPAIAWLTGGVALADAGPAETAIRDVLDRYRRAMEAREVKTLAGLYTEFPAELQAAQERYFDNVRDLHVAIDNLDIVVVGDEAVVSYTRSDDFTDVRTGRPMHAAVRVTKVLRQVDGAWKLTVQ
jgi:3-oxoacyl-(acyl-carrier-protein) synthase